MKLTNLHHHGPGEYRLVLRDQNTIDYHRDKCTVSGKTMTCTPDWLPIDNGNNLIVGQESKWITDGDRNIEMQIQDGSNLEIHCTHEWTISDASADQTRRVQTCAKLDEMCEGRCSSPECAHSPVCPKYPLNDRGVAHIPYAYETFVLNNNGSIDMHGHSRPEQKGYLNWTYDVSRDEHRDTPNPCNDYMSFTLTNDDKSKITYNTGRSMSNPKFSMGIINWDAENPLKVKFGGCGDAEFSPEDNRCSLTTRPCADRKGVCAAVCGAYYTDVFDIWTENGWHGRPPSQYDKNGHVGL